MDSTQNQVNNQKQTEELMKRSTAADIVQTESIVKKVMTNEVKYLIAVVMFLAGVVAPYFSIRQEIALIKQNDFAHIETMTKDIATNTADIKELRTTEVTLMSTISAQNAQIQMLLNKLK
jgi:hypothetical protein